MQVKLKVLAGKNSGKELPVPVKRFLIGRGDDCHMRPKSEAISRNHCAILINEEEDEVIIRDLNSRNGTYLNGERLAADQALESGDHLQVGRLEFEVLIKDRKRAPAPAAASAPRGDSSASLDFDISEWLHEAETSEKAQKKSDPETRQFKIDETDRIALEAAKRTLDSVDGIEMPAAKTDESGTKKFERPKKQAPGKLPETAKAAAASSSRDAAADMLKKFFNNR
jgi:pSer/pThr/pTyr-binding forkhead associated (FHA) protein